MGWESSSDTFTELKLTFKSKNLQSIMQKKINYEIIEPKNRKTVKNLMQIIF